MYRPKDRLIAGVCGGIAKQLGVSALAVRLLFLTAFWFFGAGPLLYIVLWIVIPSES